MYILRKNYPSKKLSIAAVIYNKYIVISNKYIVGNIQ